MFGHSFPRSFVNPISSVIREFYRHMNDAGKIRFTGGYPAADLFDKCGRRRVYMACVAFAIVVDFPAIWRINTGIPAMFWLAMALGLGVANYGQYGSVSTYFAELFDTKVRYSGASISYHLGGAVFHGTTPLNPNRKKAV